MDTKDKDLLLKDLCARLPYGVIIQGLDKAEPLTIKNLAINMAMSDNLYLPYLRPMSSMTEEEKEEYEMLQVYPGFKTNHTDLTDMYDWLNKKMFDYRGLIPMGLALEAPKGMYKTK